jgi:hypothetical protein
MRNNQERFTGGMETPQFNFTVPVELVDLPSAGKYYPPGHPLHKKQHVEIREMTAKEEDILTNKSYIDKGIVLDKLVQSVLVDKSIDVSSILTLDKNAILIAARITAYGEDYPVSMTCGDCGQQSETNVDLKELLKIQPATIPEGGSETERGTISLTLPSSKWSVELKPLTGTDQQILEKNLETKRRAKIEDGVVIETLKSFIVSVNGHTQHSTIESAVAAMPAKDSRYIRSAYPKLFPNISSVCPVVCGVCNSTVDMEVPFNINFFWPK